MCGCVAAALSSVSYPGWDGTCGRGVAAVFICRWGSSAPCPTLVSFLDYYSLISLPDI